MSDTIILRIYSKQGRSRLEIMPTDTFLYLKQQIEQKLNISQKQLQLYLDEQCKMKLQGRDGDQLKTLKLKNGDIIHIGNMEIQQKIQKKQQTEQIDTSTKKQEQIMSPGKSKQHKPLTEEEVKKSHCTHGPNGKCINCLGVSKENMKFIKHQCTHPPNQKCPNCLNEQEQLMNTKHESFEHYLSEIKAKCKKTHRSDQKCQNCVPNFKFSYKVNYLCPNHKPFPEGMCNKCLPPSVVLSRQSYRHVDYISFMNFEEMASFVGYWQQIGCFEQRMGYLYGYYSEDPNYPQGVRVNVEAIYEPPQVSEINGALELDDKVLRKVDMLAEALTLERVGWIFTSINQDVYLTAQEIRKIAQYQEQHNVSHPEGYKVSKFVTVVVKPRGDGYETGVDCYMVSDQCQALERDNVFGNSESKKKMVLREVGTNEMLPSVVKEGKPVKEFEPDFFIVSLAHGQPKSKNDYNILKNYDFPVANRQKQIERKDYVNYIKKHKGEKGKRKFACFQMLIYLADLMDIGTATAISDSIGKDQDIDAALVELLESI